MGKKIFREPLKEEWADALLASPVPCLPGESSRSIAGHLQTTRCALARAIELANETLAANSLVATVAAAAARAAGRRGEASISVDPSGTVMLEIRYKKPTEGDPKRAWSSDLPSIEVLRQEAEALGISTRGFGRNKRLFRAAIDAARKIREAAAPAPKTGKRIKTAPALTQPVVHDTRVLAFAPESEVPADLDLPTPSR